MKATGIGLLMMLALWLSGCGPREHLREDFGRQNRAYFNKQRIWQQPAAGTPSGLDSEEAAAIHGTYRKNMGAKGAAEPASSPAKVLLVQESKDGPKR